MVRPPSTALWTVLQDAVSFLSYSFTGWPEHSRQVVLTKAIPRITAGLASFLYLFKQPLLQHGDFSDVSVGHW